MEKKLEGKRALVTGGSRGIGRAIAIAFAEAGADVAIGYRRDVDAAAATLKEVEAHGRRGIAHAADVRDGEAVAALVEAAPPAVGGHARRPERRAAASTSWSRTPVYRPASNRSRRWTRAIGSA